MSQSTYCVRITGWQHIEFGFIPADVEAAAQVAEQMKLKPEKLTAIIAGYDTMEWPRRLGIDLSREYRTRGEAEDVADWIRCAYDPRGLAPATEVWEKT